MKKLYPFLVCIFLAKFGAAQCAFTINTQVYQPIHCFGGSDGALTATVTGGTGPFTFAWKYNSNNTVISTNDTITNLLSGSYKVIVTDQGAACTDSVSFNLTEPQQLFVFGNPINPTCGQPNGMVSIMANGGTAGYTYSLFPGGAGGGGFYSNLTPGTYTVMAIDAFGCQAFNNVTLYSTPLPTVTLSSTPAHCGICDGTASVIPSGGTPPYTYSWNTFPAVQTGSTAYNLCGNTTYTYTIVDGNGCVVTGSGNVTTNSPGSSIASVVPSACGQGNGSVSITAASGMIPPFQYSFNGAPFQASSVFSNLSAGIYAVVVLDSVNCQSNATAIVSDSTMNLQLNATMPSCTACDGSVATSIIGGTLPYTYQWSNGAGTASVSALCTGNYFVEVTDANGCYSAASAALAPTSAPVIQVDTVINASCTGNGSVQVSITGGTPAYTYMWQPGGNTTPNPSLSAGLYTLTVTDANGCSSNQNVYIGNNVHVYVSGTQASPNCSNPGWIVASGYGGTPPYSYSWSTGAITDSISAPTANMYYYVTVTDANGCQGNGNFYLYPACYNIINGRVYNDANQNCVQDPGETGLPGKIVTTANSYYAYTDANGNYSIQTPEMSTSLSLYNGYTPYLSPSCPATGTLPASFAQQGDTMNHADFGYYADPNYFNVGIHPGWSSATPGFQKQYWVMVENNSPTAQNVVVTFIYDSVLQYISCDNGGVHYPAQHKIEWTFTNVPAGYHWGPWNSRPTAYFTVPVSVSLNYQLQTFFQITPLAGDAYPGDNTLTASEPVTGSHDPNAKSASPAGFGPFGLISPSDTTLLYTIHFQNNGNDTAYRVVVVDTLSANVDPLTIVPGASSHPYTFTLSGQGIMTWTFDHIMLPDSLTDPVGSNGYFNYTVRQRPNLPDGSQILNTGYIYFDFNTPVVTNTTLHTIVYPIGINEVKGGKDGLFLFPNPAAGEVMVQYTMPAQSEMKLCVYNILGNLVRSQAVLAQKGLNTERLDLSGMGSGVYIIELSDTKTKSVQKLIIQK